MDPKNDEMKRNMILKLVLRVPAYLLWLFSKLLFWRHQERIWLIGCGGERWGDNADALWRYLNKKHPDIKALAVIKKESDLDQHHMAWVKRRSWGNLLLLQKAEALITTHALTEVGPESISFLSPAVKVRIEHGVIGIKKMPSDDHSFKQFDLICASSVKEKAIMAGEMGLDPGKIRITGLARHDDLKASGDSYRREGILYMPTIRDWVTAEDESFYQEMLFSWIEHYSSQANPVLIKLWLHPNWYKKGFGAINIPNLSKIDLGQDPQQVLLESEMLVTDYSSMAFDAALSGRPVVFFQPDREQFSKRRGLYEDFLAQDNLLVVGDEQELVAVIGHLLSDKKYRESRVAEDQKWAYQYVETFDGKACERIYHEINSLIAGR